MPTPVVRYSARWPYPYQTQTSACGLLCVQRMNGNSNGNLSVWESWARRATDAAGSTWAFAGALATVLIWLACGPVFDYSDTWQLVINTGTTIVTFLMVFLIQRAQNKDAHAIHLKLNEIVAGLKGASNRLINVEDLSEEQVLTLHRHYEELAELAKRKKKLTESHSVEEARSRHERK